MTKSSRTIDQFFMVFKVDPALNYNPVFSFSFQGTWIGKALNCNARFRFDLLDLIQFLECVDWKL